MDIPVGGPCSRRAFDCPSAGEAAVPTPAIHDAPVPALGADREPIPAKASRPVDSAATLRDYCPDCNAICPAATEHATKVITDQGRVLPWP